MMASGDKWMEIHFDIFNEQGSEQDRADVAKYGALAMQWRANKIKQQRMQRSIEKRAAERRALRASATGERDQCEHTSNPAAISLTPLQPGVGGKTE